MTRLTMSGRRPLLKAAWALAPAWAADLPTAPLTIVTSDGVAHPFTVEIAATPETREHGLMDRPSMASDAGMLFEFPDSELVAFWMKDTLIPLDMLFIDRNGRIVHIAERAIPLDLTPISSVEPVTAVLELNGGTASRLKIATGDKIVHPFFQH